MAASDAAVEGISGAMGAMIACVTTYPLMTVSTNQAVRRKSADAEGGGAEVKQRGALAEVSEIIRSQGWQGLYAGIEPALLGTGVSQGVYFYLYSLLRKAAVTRQKNLGLEGAAAHDIGIAGSLLVASLAGCGNVVLTNPFWVLVTRMQTDKMVAKGPLSVIRELHNESGLMGFWKGVVPSLVMVANPTVQYMLYEWLKARLAEYKVPGKKGRRQKETSSEIFLMSAAAKLGATLVTYPMQLVKARLQASSSPNSSEPPYSGTLDALQKIYEAEGALGFYNGMRTKIVQSVLAAALLFLLKEKLTASVRGALIRASKAS
mmetsp:Transcript_22630/g.62812  ORF Transcript_22630/g.62812 Transcript_22630/m.62812 type:complete len:319 (+) Transcript_22630:175-1131(+)